MAEAVIDAAAKLQLVDAQGVPAAPADNGAKLQLDEETGEWVTSFRTQQHDASWCGASNSPVPRSLRAS